MDIDHTECKKATRWYQACEHIWDKVKELNHKDKLNKNKGLDHSISDTIDDLVIEKHKEVFSRAQNSNQNKNV